MENQTCCRPFPLACNLAFSLSSSSVQKPSPVVAKWLTKSERTVEKYKQTKPEGGDPTAVAAVSRAIASASTNKRHRSRIARLHAIVRQHILKRRALVDQTMLAQANSEELALVCTAAGHQVHRHYFECDLNLELLFTTTSICCPERLQTHTCVA